MNTSFKILFVAFLSLAIGMSACKEEKKVVKKIKTSKKIVKAKPVQKKVVAEVIKKPIDKYFLIAASFKKQSNAEKMKSNLVNNGYDSQIIISKNQFFRVSYRGFSAKKEAFKELKIARSTEGRKDVWLHIKH